MHWAKSPLVPAAVLAFVSVDCSLGREVFDGDLTCAALCEFLFLVFN